MDLTVRSCCDFFEGFRLKDATRINLDGMSEVMFRHAATAAVIVAHPDDETLWAGGFILNQPAWEWTILSLCRGSDPDRAPRFREVLKAFGAQGNMADLDDGPEQKPLAEKEILETILDLLPERDYDLVITHDPCGEYTRHLRHEETGRSVIRLWHEGKIRTGELWTFAYGDGGRKTLPAAMISADLYFRWPEDTGKRKRGIITELYGFSPDSFEAGSALPNEAFWQFSDPQSALQRSKKAALKIN